MNLVPKESLKQVFYDVIGRCPTRYGDKNGTTLVSDKIQG